MNSTLEVRVLKWLMRGGRCSAPLIIVPVCVLSYVQLCNPMDCIASQAPLKIPWDFPGKKTRVGCHWGLKVEIRRRFLVTRNIYRFPQGWLLWYGMSKKLVLRGAQGRCTGVTPRDGMGREVGQSSGWGTHVHPCLIHVNVWQKPLHYCN